MVGLRQEEEATDDSFLNVFSLPVTVIHACCFTTKNMSV